MMSPATLAKATGSQPVKRYIRETSSRTMRGMTSPIRDRSVRPFAITAVGILAIVLVTVAVAVGLGFGGSGACAYVPSGQRQYPIGTYVTVFGPPIVTFFVLAYFALGLRSKLTRVTALAATLLITGVVALVSLMFLQPVCGF
jgi:hypothetical protein